MRIATEVLVESIKTIYLQRLSMSVKMQQMPMMWCRILFFNIIQPTDNLKMSSISEHGSFGWQSIKQRTSIFLSGGRRVCR